MDRNFQSDYTDHQPENYYMNSYYPYPYPQEDGKYANQNEGVPQPHPQHWDINAHG